MWVQEKQETGELGYSTGGDVNPSDAGAKHLPEEKIRRCMRDSCPKVEWGRASVSLVYTV